MKRRVEDVSLVWTIPRNGRFRLLRQHQKRTLTRNFCQHSRILPSSLPFSPPVVNWGVLSLRRKCVIFDRQHISKFSFFLFFLVLNSLNGCWIRNWAIFRNPVGRATRFPSTSVRHSWVSCPNYLFVLRNCVFGPRWKLDLRLFSSCYFSFPAQLGCKSYSCPRKGHLFFRL